jgi:hypothetical protein
MTGLTRFAPSLSNRQPRLPVRLPKTNGKSLIYKDLQGTEGARGEGE